ncbi:MAG TPA: flavodoxin domain-containing protein [Planctomycetota bacterium]|nr:flavodoxin domain-containing protein [Planctomycetota bacterium]
MDDRILIAYATKHGSTEGIARAIGKAFTEEGAQADVKPVGEAGEPGGYRAVVLGSPLYAGKVLGGIRRFAEEHAEELRSMPTALFFVCLTMAQPSERAVQKVVKQTKPLVELVRPRDVGLFAGALDYADLGFFNRLLMKLMKIREGDFRKWDVIERWAKDLLPRLQDTS